MAKLAPPLDRRTASDIVQQVQHLLSSYLPDRFSADRPLGPTHEALVQVFARYGELMIQRLNQTPEKNFLAFLNLLGASQLPPQPARVPLTFHLSTGSAVDTVVPIHTQVTALPEKGDSDPVLFETEWELTVTATQLNALYSYDPATDQHTNHQQLLQGNGAAAELIFQSNTSLNQTLYFGFQPPAQQSFPNRVLSLYIATQVNQYQPDLRHDRSSSAQLLWEYWDGLSWQTFLVEDGTQALTHSGLVEFLVPETFRPSSQFGIEQYWLRLRWEQGTYSIPPRLQQVLLNTTLATQTITLRNEMLGSSNGIEHQKFRTVRSPVLAEQVLEVREPEGWVRWQEIQDFHGSQAGDRHYVLNALTGEILFGDGARGRIPPIGANNIRMTYYQSGGGSIGNRAAGTIVELKTTLPYIDRVANPEAAAGGADAETLDLLKERAPRMIRHGGRAVTLEDYEDLAMLASPAVARAKCIPLKQLSKNPQDTQNTPGEVSVLIVPQSQDIKPVPSLELLERVNTYLSRRALPTVNLAVVGPLYVKVELDVEISLTSLDGTEAVRKSIHQALVKFLHPLTGGFEGRGWPFGREPHKSDFYALLEAIPGVDHVRSLRITETLDRRLNLAIAEAEDLIRTKETGRFLVYSGTHNIQLTVEP